MAKTGVFPVYENQFKVGTPTELSPIAEMESFSVSIDGKVEEWSPFEAEGWIKRMMTGKGLVISLKGKRSVGDPGNDFIHDCAFKTGKDCESQFEWDFPSGGKLAFPCVINVTNPGGGDSTGVDALEADIMSNGKPTYTPAPGTMQAAQKTVSAPTTKTT